MKKILICAWMAMLLMVGVAFGETQMSIVATQMSIVATDFPCYDFARQIAGEWADVKMLIRPGVEVHSFEPSPTDILEIGEADLFVYIGGESDAWADNILASFDGEDGPETLRMIENVHLSLEAHHHEDHAGHEDHSQTPEYDEHIWTSPKNALVMVETLCEKMAAMDPAHSEDYRANAEAYIAEISAIDAAFEEISENAVRRTLVFGDRFPFIYFTQAYGFEYEAAFESCTAEAEPSPMTLMKLIETVKRESIPVIYTIEMSTQNIARTIAEETGAEICTLHSLQTVTQDEFAAGESYVSIMWKNVEAVRKGLN